MDSPVGDDDSVGHRGPTTQLRAMAIDSPEAVLAVPGVDMFDEGMGATPSMAT